MKRAVKIHKDDNVAVALVALKKGDSFFGVDLQEDILAGHKFALVQIQRGDSIIKYGYPIGSASQDIGVGMHVHTHNTKTKLDVECQYTYSKKNYALAGEGKGSDVSVFERKNGEVGIRNELWVIPTVGCVNAQAKQIVMQFTKRHENDLLVDGVFAFTHPYGCSQMGDDHEFTKKTLQNIVLHPNAGGVLVLGLGCENNGLEEFKRTLGAHDSDRIKFLNAQDCVDEIEDGVSVLEGLYDLAKTDVRTNKPFSCLKIGLKCGGSDGLSGITANPLLGRLSDYATGVGATTVLTEIPEMFGAEQMLMERAENEAVFDKMVKTITDFKSYYKSNNQVVYENPSPGNYSGGISTLEDKSLGCVQKGGHAEIVDVLNDCERIKKAGLNILNGPGNDIVAVTNLGAAGCHMVLFSTGRGTPLGGFVPTVKVASNSTLFMNKKNWIDFNADCPDLPVLEFIEYVAKVANGSKTKNEINNSREIAIFKSGVTL